MLYLRSSIDELRCPGDDMLPSAASVAAAAVSQRHSVGTNIARIGSMPLNSSTLQLRPGLRRFLYVFHMHVYFCSVLVISVYTIIHNGDAAIVMMGVFVYMLSSYLPHSPHHALGIVPKYIPVEIFFGFVERFTSPLGRLAPAV